jgi:hypothetical protein
MIKMVTLLLVHPALVKSVSHFLTAIILKTSPVIGRYLLSITSREAKYTHTTSSRANSELPQVQSIQNRVSIAKLENICINSQISCHFKRSVNYI